MIKLAGKIARITHSSYSVAHRSTCLLWILFVLFTVAMMFNIHRNPLDSSDTQMDEQGHISYAATLINQNRWWPNFEHFPMVDRTTLTPLKDINYINHPPTFYWLIKLMHQVYPSISAVHYRALSIMLIICAMALYTRIGTQLKLPWLSAAFYGLLPFLIYMQFQTGFFNNDSAAILGGMLAVYSSMLWFEGICTKRGYYFMFAGLVLASVKLTSFILVGLYVVICLLMLSNRRQQISAVQWLFAAMISLMLLVPYVMLLYYAGSFAPETLGQVDFMSHGHSNGVWERRPMEGWVKNPRMDFLNWLLTFFRNFAVQVGQFDTTFIPLLILVVYTIYRLISVSTVRNPLSLITIAGLWATIITLIIHLLFSWPRYQKFGWLLDSGLRYYFPLLAVYGAACGAAIAACISKKGHNDQTHR